MKKPWSNPTRPGLKDSTTFLHAFCLNWILERKLCRRIKEEKTSEGDAINYRLLMFMHQRLLANLSPSSIASPFTLFVQFLSIKIIRKIGLTSWVSTRRSDGGKIFHEFWIESEMFVFEIFFASIFPPFLTSCSKKCTWSNSLKLIYFSSKLKQAAERAITIFQSRHTETNAFEASREGKDKTKM